MDKINWDRAIALEIIQAGFIRMAKKFHPDVGGTQEQMLALTATKEHLEKFIAGGRSEYASDSFTYTRAREEPRRGRSTYRHWNTQSKSESTEEVPLEDYADDLDYVALRDVTVMSTTEKAVRIKIPGVKQGQWLPKSQMLADHFDYMDGDVITVVFTKWIARQKGWMK